MLRDKKRKEVHLDPETLALLQVQAEKKGRKLKNYMEYILKEKAHDFELTDDYKVMMDETLEQHKQGEINYTLWEDVKKEMLNN